MTRLSTTEKIVIELCVTAFAHHTDQRKVATSRMPTDFVVISFGEETVCKDKSVLIISCNITCFCVYHQDARSHGPL